MKRILILLAITFYFTNNVKATHTLGGEISWECKPTGQYVFTMKFFRDCSGISWGFWGTNQTIQIFGGPFPRNAAGQPFQSITVKPDSLTYVTNRNGDTSPLCNAALGDPLNCPNANTPNANGLIQVFYYKSDPITMSGIPGRSGWNFRWESACCRPGGMTNVMFPSQPLILRATMFPTKERANANPCIDSSPDFRALPNSAICRGLPFTYNPTAIDADLDSLVYTWSNAVNTPIEDIPGIPYFPGYSSTNPTPDKAIDIDNVPATLNPLTGVVNLKVVSGTGTQKFLLAFKVDAYRDGTKIATVHREFPLAVFNCTKFPNGNTNNPPRVRIDGIDANDVIIQAVAGQRVRVPIEVTDKDITGVGTQLQTITVIPDGLMFNNDKTKTGRCQVVRGRGKSLVVEPCAYLQNTTPFLDRTVAPPVHKLEGLATVKSFFIWNTDCRHVSLNTGAPGTNFGVYSFVFRVQDDNCPIPATNYPTITVRIKDPFPLTEPIVKGVSVGLDGFITYQWAPPLDSSGTFDKYVVETATVSNGSALSPSSFQVIDPDLDKYHSAENFNNNLYFVPSQTNPLLPNILRKQPDRDWYLRMTAESGCSDTVTSGPSEPVRVIEPSTIPSGKTPLFPLRSRATITWNRPKSKNAATKAEFFYESKTHFYIWENDSVSNGQVDVFDNWYLRGDTVDVTEYSVNSNVCGDFAAFRIEARDTVIMPKQGNPIDLLGAVPDSMDTLIFSTYSIIDTMFMVTPGFIPKPKFDTVRVMSNGDVYFRINTANSGTIGSYNIYANSVSQANLLASFDLINQDSILIQSQGADAAEKRYILEGIDECNPSTVEQSFVYNTFIPGGNVGPPCSGLYELNWKRPEGFPRGATGYQVYIDSTGTSSKFRLDQTINDASVTEAQVQVVRNKTYNFQIVAFDADGDVIMSAIHTYTTPVDARTSEIVPSPEMRCTYVEDNGEVTVSFIPPIDLTDNFVRYEFEYSTNGGASFTSATTNPLPVAFADTTVTLTGINAHNGMIIIRATTISGCSASEPSAPRIIQTIDVTATPRAIPNEKTGDISWNNTGINGGGDYTLNKDSVTTRYPATSFFSWPFIPNQSQVDNQNSQICLGTFNYYATQQDVSGCQNRSNIGTATYEDMSPPAPLHFDYISYDLVTDQMIVTWNNENPGDVDTIKITTPDGFNSGQPQFRGLIDQKWEIIPKRDTIPISALDARDTSVEIGATTKDACDNESSENDLTFHRSMDVDVLWRVCDSTMRISWNPYEGFNENFDVIYRVYKSTTGEWNDWSPIAGSSTINTSFIDKIVAEDTYYYHIKATSADPQFTDSSNSNIDSDQAIFEDTPRFGYLRYVTVLAPPLATDEHQPNSGEIELEFVKDPLINVGGYKIYKGTEEQIMLMDSIGYVDFDSVRNNNDFKFTDPDVDVRGQSYFYKVVTHNACEVPVDTSNLGRSIKLTVRPNREALTNKLVWNNYEKWDSTVAFYNIYRGVERRPTNLVRAAVAPYSKDSSIYFDPVSDEVFAVGKFCYVVEAIQGPVSDAATNGIPNNLRPATSRSNVVCVTQKPLFYVPNAFAPDGVNQIFKPKGMFFDYSRYEMVIYNRWGEEVFRTRNIEIGWNGIYNGEIAQLGAYVYMIRFIDADGQEHRRKGTVTLIR